MFAIFLKVKLALFFLFTISFVATVAKCVTKTSAAETGNSTQAPELTSDKSNTLLIQKMDKITELLQQSLEYQKMNFLANVKFYHCQTLGLQLCVKYFQEASREGKVQLETTNVK